MRLNEVSAKTGLQWFRQGIWLFRRHPLAFLIVFLTYLFFMVAISMIPVLGTLLPWLLIPSAAVGFMAACRDVLCGKPVLPTVLLDGFRAHGGGVARDLLILGLAYLVAITLVFSVSALLDGGDLLKLMLAGDAFAQQALGNSNLPFVMLLAMLCYVPVAMLFWFAPVLVAWHGVPPHKALFFSFMACWRNRGAFLLYGLAWGALMMGLSFFLSAAMHLLGMANVALTVLMPVSLILTAMLYCSFYATYRGSFVLSAEHQPPQALGPA